MLPGDAMSAEKEEILMEEGSWYTPQQPLRSATNKLAWETTNDDAPPVVDEVIIDEAPGMLSASVPVNERVSEVWSHVSDCMYSVTRTGIVEGVRQYESIAVETKKLSMNATVSVRSGVIRTWKFLTQPVWIPGKKSKPKQYGRGALFMLDTVRFGGTFAAIFTLLFVGLNFQSFWSIAESYVDPLTEVTGMTVSDDNRKLAEKLKKIPMLATAGDQNGSLTDFLPMVGPPENRLVIPSLELNVPIVIPNNAALMEENWSKLEEDIQLSLQDGVVHYPGTARPGKPGNFFVTGHSSYFPWAPGEYKSVFARLHELKVGDEYWVFYGGDRHRYVIKEKKEIKPSDVTVLDQPTNKRISTLMTCTPVGTTLRRLIIVAQEIDPMTGESLAVGDRGHDEEMPQLKMQALPI